MVLVIVCMDLEEEYQEKNGIFYQKFSLGVVSVNSKENLCLSGKKNWEKCLRNRLQVRDLEDRPPLNMTK